MPTTANANGSKRRHSVGEIYVYPEPNPGMREIHESPELRITWRTTVIWFGIDATQVL